MAANNGSCWFVYLNKICYIFNGGNTCREEKKKPSNT
jgi:hypothetical protein